MVGGSGGSARLNAAVRAALPRWRARGLSGLWLGAAHDDDGGGVLTPSPWTSDFAGALAAVDVVVTVGGAVTLAEAAAIGRPCVVLPRRDVAADHQRQNAEVLAAQGAVVHTTARALADDVVAVVDDAARARSLVAGLLRWAGRDAQGRRADPAAHLVALALAGRR